MADLVTKQNDWVVAGITNPQYTSSEFLLAGLNVDNTLLLSEDQYKQTEFIQKSFLKNGQFDEEGFHDYYTKRVRDFLLLSEMNPDAPIYDILDPRADKVTTSPHFSLVVVPNTTRQKKMLTGATYESGLSMRELAQTNHILDTKTGEWSEDTLNDRALVKSPIKWAKTMLFGEPLVYSTYESDGTHWDPFLGLEVEHHKGEYQINQYGTPFTETLNGRSLLGKEVVSGFDTLTVDGVGVDKYNFMDSDDILKSVAGTIAKTAMVIAPMLISGVGNVYAGALVLREFTKTLPMLQSFLTSWFGVQPSGLLNTLAAKAEGGSMSVSDAGKSSIMNVETMSNLVSDIVTLYGTLRFIALGISKLRGTDKLMQNAMKEALANYMMQSAALRGSGLLSEALLARYIGTPETWQSSIIGKAAIEASTKGVEAAAMKARRLGADASLAYMALVSNTDVYLDMLEAGASKSEAALISLASTIGMFTVDKYAHLGELFFDDLTAESEKAMRRTLKKEVRSWYDNVINAEKTTPIPKSKFDKFRGLFNLGVIAGRKAVNNYVEDLQYHATGFFGKALGEGIEEVSEELVSDFAKGAYELVGELGFNTSTKDVGAFKDMGARYGMNFLGGIMGGGIFYGVNVYNNGRVSIDRTLDELIYLVRNGKTNEALDLLEKWRKQGKLGSTSLSVNTTRDADGDLVFLTAQNKESSQNEFIYNRIKETILLLDGIIRGNHANLNEELLFQKLVLNESRFQNLKDYLDNYGVSLLDFSYSTGYQLEYLDVVSRLVNAQSVYETALKTRLGVVEVNGVIQEQLTDEQLRHLTPQENQTREANLKKFEDDVKQAQEELNEFLSGKRSIDYMEKMLFALDSRVSDAFISMNFEQWLSLNHPGKTPENLTVSEKDSYEKEYLEYKKHNQKEDLTRAFALYKQVQAIMNPILEELKANQGDIRAYNDYVESLLGENSPLALVKTYNEDDVYDFAGETKDSDSYINRNTEENKKIRRQQLDDFYKRLEELIKDGLLSIIERNGNMLDPSTRRKLKLILNTRAKDRVLLKVSQIALEMRTTDDPTIERSLTPIDIAILQLLLNYDEKTTWDSILKTLEASYNDRVTTEQEALITFFQYLVDAFDNINVDISGIIGAGRTTIDQEMISQILSAVLQKRPDISFLDLFDASSLMYLDVDTEPEHAAFIATLLGKMNEVIRDSTEKDGTIKKDSATGAYQLVDWAYRLRSAAEYLATDGAEQLNYFRGIYDLFVQAIKDDPIIELTNRLNNTLKGSNYVLLVAQKLNNALNGTDIEALLEKLEDKFESINNLNDLILTAGEQELLQLVADVVNLALAYIYAALPASDYLFPFSHNFVLNDTAHNHKDIYPDWKDLPVLDQDFAYSCMVELNRYLSEIGIARNGRYNGASWLGLSRSNELDKAKQLLRAEQAWTQTMYDLFAKNKSAFVFEYAGKKIDLLNGIDNIPQVEGESDDNGVYLNAVFQLFYNNVQKCLKDNNWSFKALLIHSGLLEKLTHIDLIPQLLTSLLDESLTIDNLTDYDKMVAIATIAALDPTLFNTGLQTRIENLDSLPNSLKTVPITIQEWVERIGDAVTSSPLIFNDTLEYVALVTKCNLPIISNACYIGGVAGAGKSSVIGKGIASFIGDNKTIWLSAPAEDQVNNLLNATGRGVRKLNNSDLNGQQSLFASLGIDMGVYNKNMAIVGDPKYFRGQNITDANFKVVTENGYFSLLIDANAFGIKKVADAPAAIIIDEATHLSLLLILILSEYCKLNNTSLILLGANNQNGYCSSLGSRGLGLNVDRETCLMIRTPQLGISLRVANMQHSSNVRQIEDLLTRLNSIDYNLPDNVLLSLCLQLLQETKALQLKVYNKDTIAGDLITDTISDTDLEKLSGSIAYIGDQNSATWQKVKLKFPNSVLFDSLSVLGLEFDYVIIDKNFLIPNESSPAAITQLYQFLLDLNTMVSRGKKGSIIVDSSHKLRDFIGDNTTENVTGDIPNIREYAGDFIERKLELLNKIAATVALQLATQQLNTQLLNNLLQVTLLPTTQQQNTQQLNTQLQQTTQQLTALQQATLQLAALQLTTQLPTQSVGDDDDTDITNTNTLDTIQEDILDEESDMLEETDQKEAPASSEPMSLPAVNIIGYGNATFTGCKTRIELREDGTIFEHWVSDTSDGVKRDIQIFILPGDIDENGEITGDSYNAIMLKQRVLSLKLRNLKNSFLYGKSYEDNSEVQLLMTKEEYENIQWVLEVAPRSETDNFIRNTGLDPAKMGIGSNNLVYKIVGKFKLKDGSLAEITLGLLLNPDSLILTALQQLAKLRKLIGELEEKLKKETDRGEKNRIQKKIDTKTLQYQNLSVDNPDSRVSKYSKLIQTLDAKYNTNGPLSIPVKLTFPGMTHLVKRLRSVPLLRASTRMIRELDKTIARLEDKYNRATVSPAYKAALLEKIKRYQKKRQELMEDKSVSFHSRNPHTVISPMYIYAPKKGEVTGLDISDKVRGRCNVCFVTNDESLKPEELAQVYIEQKNNPELPARVRMVVLNNAGVSFLDMTNPYLSPLMQSTSRTIKKDSGEEVEVKRIYPFKTGYMGIRMYVGLWNFRANMLLFKEVLDPLLENIRNTTGMSDADIDEYILAKDLKWRKENGRNLSDEENEILNRVSSNPNFVEICKAIDAFNTNENLAVRQFRLGNSIENGAYVRQLEGNTRTYDLPEGQVPNGIYISIRTLNKYILMMDAVFLMLDKVVRCTDSDTGEQLDPMKIMTMNAGSRYSYSNCMLQVVQGEFEIMDVECNQDDVNKDKKICISMSSLYDEGKGEQGVLNTFSNIPPLLLKVFKATNLRQHLNDDDDFDFEAHKVTAIYSEEGVKKETVIIDDDYYQDLWRAVGIDDDAAPEEYIDDFSNMFSFAFHGTVLDVHQSGVQKATDALFPNGFYADPLASTKIITNSNGLKLFIESVQLPEFFTADVTVADPTFFVDIDLAMQEATKAPDAPSSTDIKATAELEEKARIVAACENGVCPYTTAVNPNSYIEISYDMKSKLYSIPTHYGLKEIRTLVASYIKEEIKHNKQITYKKGTRYFSGYHIIGFDEATNTVITADSIVKAFFNSLDVVIQKITSDGANLTVTTKMGDVSISLNTLRCKQLTAEPVINQEAENKKLELNTFYDKTTRFINNFLLQIDPSVKDMFNGMLLYIEDEKKKVSGYSLQETESVLADVQMQTALHLTDIIQEVVETKEIPSDILTNILGVIDNLFDISCV